MIKTERAVVVGFHVETQSLQLVDKFLFSEHFVVGMIRYSFEGYPDPSLPGFDRQVLEQKLTTGFQRPVYFRQRVSPIGYVVYDPKIHNEIESRIREFEACNIAFHKGGIRQRARSSPGPSYHSGIQIDADVSLRAEQVVNDPRASPLTATDLEDIVRRPVRKSPQARSFVMSLNKPTHRVVHRPVLDRIHQHGTATFVIPLRN